MRVLNSEIDQNLIDKKKFKKKIFQNNNKTDPVLVIYIYFNQIN